MEMCFDEAMCLLMSSKLSEVHSQAHRDIQFSWTKDNEEVANGYFNGTESTVSVRSRWGHAQFSGEESRRLMSCGILVSRLMELGKNLGTVQMLESA